MDGYLVRQFASEDSWIAYCFGREMPPNPEIVLKGSRKKGSKNMRPGERRCSICKTWKPATRAYFPPNLAVSDGCQSRCRLCDIHRYRKQDKDYNDCTIYFLQITSDGKNLNREGLIKLGRTKDLYERMRAFHYQEQVEFVILGIIKGQFDDEQIFKSWFMAYRILRHEWYKPAPELLAWIKRYTQPSDLMAHYKPVKLYHKELSFDIAA